MAMSIKVGNRVIFDDKLATVTFSNGGGYFIISCAGEDIYAHELYLTPIPDGFKPMSSAPKVHKQQLKLVASDFGVVIGWWDAEIENYWSKRQHPDNPPIPLLGDWCCNEAGRGAGGDKRMICGFTPKAWSLP